MRRNFLKFVLILFTGSVTLLAGSLTAEPRPQDLELVYSNRFGNIPTHLAQPLSLAQSDLARRLGTEPETIDVLTMHRVVWPDRCLGLLSANEVPCLLEATPGHLILLRFGRQKYRYHAGPAEYIQFAGAGSVPTALPPPVVLVRDQLSELLGVPLDSISLVDLEATVWPNTCLGLPAPELCVPGETRGFRVILVAMGQGFRYHTDLSDLFRFAGPGDVPRKPE